MPNDSLTIGQLAAHAEVNVETIRYYQRIGLVDEPGRHEGHIRRYGNEALERVRFIKRAKSLGFTLEETQELLALDGGGRCEEVRRIAEAKLARVQEKLKDLQHMETLLRAAVTECQSNPAAATCPLIERLQRDD